MIRSARKTTGKPKSKEPDRFPNRAAYLGYFNSSEQLRDILNRLRGLPVKHPPPPTGHPNLTTKEVVDHIYPDLFPLREAQGELSLPKKLSRGEAEKYIQDHPSPRLGILPARGSHYIYREEVFLFLLDYWGRFLRRRIEAAKRYYGLLCPKMPDWDRRAALALLETMTFIHPLPQYRIELAEKRLMNVADEFYFRDVFDAWKDVFWERLGQPTDRIDPSSRESFLADFTRAWNRAEKELGYLGFTFLLRPAISDRQIIEFYQRARRGFPTRHKVIAYLILLVARRPFPTIGSVYPAIRRHYINMIYQAMEPDIQASIKKSGMTIASAAERKQLDDHLKSYISQMIDEYDPAHNRWHKGSNWAWPQGTTADIAQYFSEDSVTGSAADKFSEDHRWYRPYEYLKKKIENKFWRTSLDIRRLNPPVQNPDRIDGASEPAAPGDTVATVVEFNGRSYRTIQGMMEYLGISLSTARRWDKSGKLPALRFGTGKNKLTARLYPIPGDAPAFDRKVEALRAEHSTLKRIADVSGVPYHKLRYEMKRLGYSKLPRADMLREAIRLASRMEQNFM